MLKYEKECAKAIQQIQITCLQDLVKRYQISRLLQSVHNWSKLTRRIVRK